MRYWTAFYTKPRSEKKCAERLMTMGFDVYCPVTTTVRQWSDRKKKVKEPVFTSYIFAQVDESERQQILLDPSVVSSVFWLKKPVRIRNEEIEEIKRFLNDFPDAKSNALNLGQGDDVVVVSGPFRGEKGVVRQKRGNKVLLQFYNLGLELQAELPEGQLNRLN